MNSHIRSSANGTTDKWQGFKPLIKDFENLIQIYSRDKGGNSPNLHRVVMHLKGWLRATHHHVSHLQDYLNEYCYRLNRSFMKEGIFENLIARMVKAEPCLIKILIIKCLNQ